MNGENVRLQVPPGRFPILRSPEKNIFIKNKAHTHTHTQSQMTLILYFSNFTMIVLLTEHSIYITKHILNILVFNV